jgi:glyoxylase-like metal-dependent hydrolase (beta-lactamase superfamily II)
MADSRAMGLVLVETFPVAPLGCNCAIVADAATRAAVVLDPGGEPDRVLEALSRHGLTAIALVHTHAHLDHCLSSARLSAETGAPVLMHEGDLPLYADLARWGRMFGVPVEAPGRVARTLAHGDRVACGGGSLEVLHTPGHTPGSICFRLEGETPVLFSGDTLFRRSVGRTDFPGGSWDDLVASIETRILTLPGDLLVLPGHGEETTIAEESRLNPFVGDRSRPLA